MKHKEFYVYVWYRKSDNKPFYVGKGKGDRYRQLVNRNRYFLNVYNKHGGYSKKLFENLTEDESIKLEKKIIKEYRKKYVLTNITDGGEGVSGLRHSDETRTRISELSKKQWRNPEAREKLIKSRRIGHSDPKVRAKMSKSHMGKVLTDEHRNNIKKAMNNKEVRERIAEARTKYRMIECIKPNGESILFYNTRDIVDWLKELGHEKALISSVIKCLTGERKTLYRYKFQLLSKEPE